MGAHSLLRRGSALCGCNDHLAYHVQTSGTVEHRHHALYLLALSALGDKTPVESLHRYHQDQALVDCYHAAAYRSGSWWCGLHHSRTLLASGLVGVLLADGFLECHSRHRCRWFLYARSRPAQTGLFRGHTKHILSYSYHRRSGSAGDACRQS